MKRTVEEWRRLIADCDDRKAGITIVQWVSDHGVDRRSYYYWHNKVQEEARSDSGLAQALEITDRVWVLCLPFRL